MTIIIKLGMNECKDCKRSLPLNLFDKEGERVRKSCKGCRLESLRKRRNEIKLVNDNKLEYVEEKVCRSCNIKLPNIAFNRHGISKDGLNSKCKECYKKNRKKKSNVQVVSPNKKTCIECNTEKIIEHFRKCAKSSDGHFHKCEGCRKPSEWTKDKQKESEKRWCERNKDKLREKWKKRSGKLQVILKQRLSARIKSALHMQSSRKNSKTYDYIGCTYDFLRSWIEYQFNEGMSWDNMGGWHIDHVIPCESYNLTEESEAFTCFNWKNLRPCWAKENMEKGSHIIPEVIEKQSILVTQFLNTPLPNLPGNREGGTK